ncbi:MAG: pentapeptide repeat-containing protein [Cyanobacteriota bacterium]
MKKIGLIKLTLSSFMLLSINYACFNSNSINSTIKEDLSKTSKYQIKGSVSFPAIKGLSIKSTNNKFRIKDTESDTALNSSISLINLPNHPTNPNKTIVTGLTDNNGRFAINPSFDFNPHDGDIFILEARKRIYTTKNNVVTMRTYVQFEGNKWLSLSTPTININSKTTAYAILTPDINSAIFSSVVLSISSENDTFLTNIPPEINKIFKLVKSVLEQGSDPLSIIKKQPDGEYKTDVKVEYNGFVQKDKCKFCKFTPTDVASFSFAGKDLSDADLSGLDLSNKDLSNTILYKANLSNTTLNLTNLTNTDLTGANLDHCKIDNAIISETIFKNANIQYADLKNLDLSYIDFTGSNLQASFFDNVTLTGANFTNASLSATKYAQMPINLKGCILDKTNLSSLSFDNSKFDGYTFKDVIAKNSSFQNADFSKALLLSGDFTESNFSSSNISNTNVINSNFTKAGFALTNFSNSNVINCNFDSAYIEKANFYYTNLSKSIFKNNYQPTADFHSANLEQSDILMLDYLYRHPFANNYQTISSFSGAVFRNQDFRNADLSRRIYVGAIFTKSNLSGANIYGSNFNGASMYNMTGFDGIEIPKPPVLYDTSDLDGNKEIYSLMPDESPEDSTGYPKYKLNASNFNIYRKKLTNTPTKYSYNSSLSPNGRNVIYVEIGSNEDIYIMDTSGTNPKQLTNSTDNEYSPVFSYDGNKIIYTKEINGTSEIAIMNIDGTSQSLITNNPLTADKEPSISPYDKIAFRSNRTGKRQIFTMDFAGHNLKQLSDNTSNDFEPKYSRDGKRILFLSDKDTGSTSNPNLWIMNEDGTNKIKLNTYKTINAFWSEDSNRILYTINKGVTLNEIRMVKLDQTGNPIFYEQIKSPYTDSGYYTNITAKGWMLGLDNGVDTFMKGIYYSADTPNNITDVYGYYYDYMGKWNVTQVLSAVSFN